MLHQVAVPLEQLCGLSSSVSWMSETLEAGNPWYTHVITVWSMYQTLEYFIKCYFLFNKGGGWEMLNLCDMIFEAVEVLYILDTYSSCALNLDNHYWVGIILS